MKNKEFEKFKQTGNVSDYLKYIKQKKIDMEASLEFKNGTKRRNSNKDN